MASADGAGTVLLVNGTSLFYRPNGVDSQDTFPLVNCAGMSLSALENLKWKIEKFNGSGTEKMRLTLENAQGTFIDEFSLVNSTGAPSTPIGYLQQGGLGVSPVMWYREISFRNALGDVTHAWRLKEGGLAPFIGSVPISSSVNIGTGHLPADPSSPGSDILGNPLPKPGFNRHLPGTLDRNAQNAPDLNGLYAPGSEEAWEQVPVGAERRYAREEEGVKTDLLSYSLPPSFTESRSIRKYLNLD